MANWARVQFLPPEYQMKVNQIYSQFVPLEVRHYLADWLEDKIWQDESKVLPTFVEDLVQEIRVRCDRMMSQDQCYVTRMKLIEAAANIHEIYVNNPSELFVYIKRCLEAEMELIEQATQGYTQMSSPGYPPQPVAERKYSELLNGLNNVRASVTDACNEIKKMQTHVESFSLLYHECLKHKSHFNYLMSQGNTSHETMNRVRSNMESQQRQLDEMVNQQKIMIESVIVRLRNNIDTLAIVQGEVLDKQLMKWKREQQLHGNGVKMETSLDLIQEWCEALAELIWSNRQQVNNVVRIIQTLLPELRQQQNGELLAELNTRITCLLSTLVTSTFVIEKQPPQVMKTNTRFTATVRLLVGGQLNLHMSPPKVSVTIIAEPQAQQLLRSDSSDGEVRQPKECGEILNNTGLMEFNPTHKHLSVSFRNMQLRKIKRAEKKGTESVMDEKLTLFFQSKFRVGSGEFEYLVWTLSLPVVVIVHGNQEPHGWATVTWDNAFSMPQRLPFAVPDKVTWTQLAETLYVKWKASTDGELTAENLQFLAEKISRNTGSQLTLTDINNMTVTWTQFCKDALPERNFTFWEWFYNVSKVTKDYLKAQWCDQLIKGFIQKHQAESMLSTCRSGTFLLRFSDSELGGITIAWVTDSEVFSLQPFTARDLSLRSLADRIMDLQQLQFLYPNVPKNDVFSKYYTKPEDTPKNGYVRPVLVTTLPAPYNHSFISSPDSQRNTPSAQSSMYNYQPDIDEYLMDDTMDLLDLNPQF